MKRLFTIFAVVAVIFQSVAQTYYVKPQFKTVITTNWVKPGPFLRVVNDQTYNIAYSKLWGTPIDLLGGFPRLADNGHPIRYEIVAEQIKGDQVLCSIDAITYWWETYTGVQQDESRDSVKEVVILNYPNPEKLVTGQAFSCRCMRVNNYISPSGVSFAAFDCGIQATNLVPVVKEEKIKIASTNSTAAQ